MKRPNAFARSLDSSIPIVAVTAHALSHVRTKCSAAGMNDFISKPVDLQCLAEKLAQWCPPAQPSSGRRQSRAHPRPQIAHSL